MRTVTIPLEEYEQIKSFETQLKEFKTQDGIFVRVYISGQSITWEVHTKEEIIEKMNLEIMDLRMELSRCRRTQIKNKSLVQKFFKI